MRRNYKEEGIICNICKKRPSQFINMQNCRICQNIQNRKLRAHRKEQKAKKGLPDAGKRKPIGHEARLAAHTKRIRERCGIKD